MSTSATSATPSVLFVCVHNAGRSQMAAAFLSHLGGDRVQVRSAGSAPADSVNAAVVDAMRDACPCFPGKRYLDWQLEDPASQGVEAVRPIRDEIERRVRVLLPELGIEAGA
ncbi:phosphotyrosine protein phosphatase [Streptomyces sp. NPDC002138]|uniref:arsenate reductase/protein-tyrosine-phosphatase family protein n=1 Tax=Streptomyces sp. NPDC002138 TaxID=3154410 RepID=UPI0033283367